jgi:hypothetical protein
MNLIEVTDPPWYSAVSPGVSPAFSFSQQANVGTGSFLSTGQVETSETGQPIFGRNKLSRMRVSVSRTELTPVTFSLSYRTGANTHVFITGADITIPAGEYTSSDTYNIDLPDDVELCVSVTSGSCRNPVLIVFLLPR